MIEAQNEILTWKPRLVNQVVMQEKLWFSSVEE